MNRLDGLSPKFRSRVDAALARMRADDDLRAAGVSGILVIEGLRQLPVQMAYFSKGRMEPDNVRAMYAAAGLYSPGDDEAKRPVTWTLKSRHLDGKAVDLAPSRDGKSPWWDAPPAVWERMGLIGQAFGLSWGGTWPDRKKDSPHFEEVYE